ncbi:uncharacterized protein [Anoplolepis gracilipes]|uniref:uncharacterized protein n=1 Tax=Anoplolepis gracilipes TaxID=354296 RepID=UPI003BA126E4
MVTAESLKPGFSSILPTTPGCPSGKQQHYQITIHQDDRDLQRVLWYDQNGRVIPHQFTTATYGLNCAPFLALRTILQLIKDEGQRFPKAIVPLIKSRYVDDIFGGADTIPEAKETIQQLTQLCEAGKFPLQKWNSNCTEVLLNSVIEMPSTVEFESSLCKILGLVWQPVTDTFHFEAAITSSASTLTKRVVASKIARLYDPLGLIAPALIKAKIILQELWLTKAD